MTERIGNECKLGFKSENRNLHYCVSCNINFNTNYPAFYLNRKKLTKKLGNNTERLQKHAILVSKIC